MKKTFVQLRRKIEDHARQICASFDDNHDFEHHLQRVERDAVYIAQEEGADPDVTRTAALLHELGLAEDREGHEKRGAQRAEEFLRQHGVLEKAARAVANAIRDNDHERVAHGSLEAKCLYDADNLQTIGAYGFVRVFSDMIHVLDRLSPHEAMRRLPRYQKRQLSRFQTKTGRRMAGIYHGVMPDFYRQYRNFETLA